MSLSKHQAPPILGPLEFYGLENKIILIEHGEQTETFNPINLYKQCLDEKLILSFGSHLIGMTLGAYHIHVNTDSIYKTSRSIREAGGQFDFFLIDQVQLMDVNLHKKDRGAQIKAHLSMVSSKKILKGSNIIITSTESEYSLRDIADKFYNLK